ncbi:MAG: hypothetical protein ACRYFS_04130 [Janthinobacterium lividum]
MIELPPDLEHQLREKAARRGQDVMDYLRLILDQNPILSNGANSLKPEDYPREGEDWTEEEMQRELYWGMRQRVGE